MFNKIFHRSKKNYILLLLISGNLSQLQAEMWTSPLPLTICSPRGKSLARVLPPQEIKQGEWTKSVFIIYKLEEKSQVYSEVSRFSVEGSPLSILISDEGNRIVTFDQHIFFGIGAEGCSIYDENGKQIRSWKISDIYDVKTSKLLPRSELSIRWRGGVEWLGDQRRILIRSPMRDGEGGDAVGDLVLDITELKFAKLIME